MKKTSSLLILLLLCAAPFMFTSCDKGPTVDETLAMLVDGGWDGVMDISYTKDGVTYASTHTHVEFWNSANSTTSGHGRWCNTFDDNAPITYLNYDFSWEAKDQVIYIQFKTNNSEYADKAKMKICTYLITEFKFIGQLSSTNNSNSVGFILTHTSSPWAWDIYPVIYPWDVYPFYPWYDPWYDPFYW